MMTASTALVPAPRHRETRREYHMRRRDETLALARECDDPPVRWLYRRLAGHYQRCIETLE